MLAPHSADEPFDEDINNLRQLSIDLEKKALKAITRASNTVQIGYMANYIADNMLSKLHYLILNRNDLIINPNHYNIETLNSFRDIPNNMHIKSAYYLAHESSNKMNDVTYKLMSAQQEIDNELRYTLSPSDSTYDSIVSELSQFYRIFEKQREQTTLLSNELKEMHETLHHKHSEIGIYLHNYQELVLRIRQKERKDENE